MLVLIAKALLGFSIFAVFRAWWKWNRLKNKLREIPGLQPKFLVGSAPILSIFKASWKTISPCTLFVDFFLGILTIFGTKDVCVFWMGTKPFFIIQKAEAAEVFLSSTTELDKSLEYSFLHGWLGTGLLTSTGQKWRSRRKLLTPSFHFRILDNFQEVFNEQSLIFVQNIKHLSANGKVLDISSLVPLVTLDMICETAMGVKLHAQGRQNSDYVNAIHIAASCIIRRFLMPLQWPAWFFRISQCGRAFFKNTGIIHNFTRRVIKERRAEILNQKDCSEETDPTRRAVFMDILLKAQVTAGLTDTDIQEEVDTFMFEGHDTTAVGLMWTFFLLGNYPEVQRKVQDEIDSIFGGDFERPITSNEIKEMKYLECVLKESLRLYPSVPFVARKLQRSIQVGKHEIPEGETCMIFLLSIHLDPRFFPEPERFNPERFLPQNNSGRHPYAFVPFSAGPRNCIGQKFALNEEKTVVAQCLRHFDLQSLNTRDQIPITAELVARPTFPLLIRFTQRKLESF